jgi:hypothetical protein
VCSSEAVHVGVAVVPERPSSVYCPVGRTVPLPFQERSG